MLVLAAAATAVVIPFVTATSAAASSCSPGIATTIKGTWRLHQTSDLTSAATGALLSPGSTVIIDDQELSPAAVTVAGFGTSAVADHTAGGWFSDLGSSATPYQVLAPACRPRSATPPQVAGPSPTGSIGGVDLQAACDRQYPGQRRTAVLLNAGSAYSWTCRSSAGNAGINVNAACAQQYGYGATAGLGSATNPWSWFCRWSITAQMQAAVVWATAEKNSPNPAWSDAYHRYWSGYCEGFVHQAERYSTSFGSATIEYTWQARNGRLHTTGTPPPGAVVFWDGGTLGHVAVSIGNGQAIGTYGFDGQHLPVRQYPIIGFLTNHYRGWAYPVGS